ncbi:RHS repeat-associated core domain-containing protein [Acinetobacter sp. 826659]|uniref:RHS repeat-associated core domain-containing protein n=1 Tax=Acinetobacter sp. 826659 TaxID=1310764 RepID=UPI001D1722CA|nr:RHS repeat-associated core domain-containing protein [Acinetobacter sp. 826659]
MKKIASIFIHSLWLCIGGMLSLLSQLTYAAPDIVAQNYSAARSPGVQSCTVGYDLMAGDISYGQNLITGALPFSLNYKAPLRQNLSAAQVFVQPEESSLGWTDNYQAHVFVQNIQSVTQEFQQFTATQVSSNPISYNLTTYNPITTSSFSAKEIIVRLPGESVATLFKEENGSFTRLYSADAIREMNNTALTQLPWSSDLGEYQLSRVGNNLIIVKNGVKYTITDTSYTLVPAQDSVSSINLYIDNYGNFRTTTSQWNTNGLYPIAISNTAPYIKNTTTVSMELYRVAKIEDQGRVLNLQYDSKMNLTQVNDQYNNKLVFERTFHDATLGTTQTIDESRLITKVTYTAAQGGTQVANFNYKAYTSKVPSTGVTTTVFALISSNSTAAGAYSYVNEMTELGPVKAYVASRGRTADSSYYYPVLRQVKNTSGQIVRQWDVTQNYVLNGTSYSTAQTTLRSYTPLSSGTAQDFTTVYDDNAKTINLTLQLANSTATSSIQSTVNADNSLTITASGYPCLTSNGTPVSSAEFKTDRSRLVKVTDANNVATSYEYDTQARITGITDADGTTLSRKTTYTYGLLNNNGVNLFLTPTSVVTPNLTITNVVNPRGQIVTQTQASSQTGSTSKVTTYAYDETTTSKHFGRLLSVDGPRSGTADKITYSYDVYGNLASQTQTVNGIARVTQYLGYNTFGEPERNLNPNGLVNQFIYNADGTLKSQTTGVGGATGTITGQTTSYTYNTLKQKISETNPDAEVTQFAYDLAGQLIQITLPNGNRIQKTYYSIGAVASEKSVTSAGLVATESYQYLDTKGRISKTQQGSDATRRYTTFIYDNNGNVIQTTTAAGVIEKWSYDVLNRVTSHTDGSGNIDTKGYDVNDNIVLSKDALNAGSNPFSYRNGNVLTQEVNTDYGTKTYSYNEADQLIQRLHGPRKCNYNTLDELGRYKAFVCAANSGTTASEYQVNNNYTYDQSRYGRLDKVTTGVTGYDVDTLYTYDAYDRVIQKGTTNQLFNRYAGTTGNTLNVNYGYSTGGKLTSMTLPSGRSVTYSYSTTGMLTGINLNGSALVRSINYDGANRVTGWQWGASGNAGYTQSYNNDGSIASLTNKDNASAVNYSLTYVYDKDGRITLVTRNNGTKDAYTYDAVDRLLSESRTTGTAATYSISYTYDKNGNRLTLNATGQHMQPAASAAYTYTTNTNKLASFTKGGVAQTFSHTANSELSYGTYLPTYDYAGRRKVDRASTDYYFMNYNHKNERSFRDKVVNGAVATMTQYIYDEQSHLIGEYDKTGALVEYVWMGDKPVAAIYGSGAATKIYYIITDAQNTPRRLVDGVTHAVVWSWDSTAFGVGNPTGSITFNLRFPGQYYDVGTNQFYNHNRFYNPELGRYMEPDPIGLEGGLNPYAYAGSNPVMNVDPSGLRLDRLSDAGMSMAYVNNSSNLEWMLRQQESIMNFSAQNTRSVYTGTGRNDFFTYNDSLSAMVAKDDAKWIGNVKGQYSRQNAADSLQFWGDFATGAGAFCLFACTPAAPFLFTAGEYIGGAGILADTELNNTQKGLSIIGGSVAGSLTTKKVLQLGGGNVSSQVSGAAVGYLVGGLPASYNETCKNIKPPYKC